MKLIRGVVINYLFNVMLFQGANSTEFDPSTPYPVVIDMPEFNPVDMGGTMRLGSRRTNFVVSSVVKDYLNALKDHESNVAVDTSPCDGLLDGPGVDIGSENENFPHLLSEFNSFRLVNADHIYARHRHR